MISKILQMMTVMLFFHKNYLIKNFLQNLVTFCWPKNGITVVIIYKIFEVMKSYSKILPFDSDIHLLIKNKKIWMILLCRCDRGSKNRPGSKFGNILYLHDDLNLVYSPNFKTVFPPLEVKVLFYYFEKSRNPLEIQEILLKIEKPPNKGLKYFLALTYVFEINPGSPLKTEKFLPQQPVDFSWNLGQHRRLFL